MSLPDDIVEVQVFESQPPFTAVQISGQNQTPLQVNFPTVGTPPFMFNGTTVSVSLVAGSNITLSSNQSSITIIGPAGAGSSNLIASSGIAITQDSAGATIQNTFPQFSLNGITGSASLVAGNNITISRSASTVTIQAASGDQYSVNGITGSVSLVAGGDVSITRSLSTVTISHTPFSVNGITGSVSLTGAGGILVSTGGNTVSISNSRMFSLNGSTGSVTIVAGGSIGLTNNASSISISASAQTALTSNLPPRISYTQNFPLSQAGVVLIGNLTATGATAASATDNVFGSSLSLQRIFLPALMSMTEIDLAFGISFPATNQGRGTMSQTAEIFSFANSTSLASFTTLSRVVSWNSGTTTSGTASSLQQGWAGNNVQPFTFPAVSLTGGAYVVGHLLSWAAASTSWTISVWGAVGNSSLTASAVTGVSSASLSAASSFATGSSALTAFTNAPTVASALLSATGTSVALTGGSVHTASGSAAITAFSGAPAVASVLVGVSGTSTALTAASALTASGSAGITAFSGAPAVASVLVGVSGTSTALIAASAFTGTTSSALTAFTAAPVAANVMLSNALGAASGVTGISHYASPAVWLQGGGASVNSASGMVLRMSASFATSSTQLAGLAYLASNAAASIYYAQSLLTSNTYLISSLGVTAGSIFTAASGSSAVMANSSTGGYNLLSSAGLSAGSFFSASTSVAAYTGGTGASSFLSTNGLLAGSFLTGSTSVAAYTGGTGASSFMSTNGLLAGSFFTASGSSAVLGNANTAGASLAVSMTTASIAALTAAGSQTAASTFATTGIPSFAYNGSFAMTTATSDGSYLSGPFIAGIMKTGSTAAGIDLGSTAVTVTGSVALQQPWFALVGS